MTTLIIAPGLIVAGVSAASAQYSPYRKEAFPYAQKHHSVCQDKARRLYSYERRAKADGRLSFRERLTVRSLERDLARTCGGYRHRG